MCLCWLCSALHLAVQYSTVQRCSTLQYSTVHYYTIQTVQYTIFLLSGLIWVGKKNTVQYITVQYRSWQEVHCTVLYCTVLYAANS